MRELDKRSRIFLLLIILLILATFFLDEVQTLLVREKIGTIRVTEPPVRRCSCVPESQIKWKFVSLVFEEKKNRGTCSKTLLEKKREPTTN